MRRTLFESLTRGPLTEIAPKPQDSGIAELAAAVDRSARRRLGRSLAIRQVDAGSCNGCELEIHALNNAFYRLVAFWAAFRRFATARRCAFGDGAGHEEYARGAGTNLSRDT